MAEIKKMKLKTPFMYGEETITEVPLNPLNTGHMIDIMNEKGEGNQALRLISGVTGWPDPKVKKIPLEDFLTLAKEAKSFLPSGLQTGKLDSPS